MVAWLQHNDGARVNCCRRSKSGTHRLEHWGIRVAVDAVERSLTKCRDDCVGFVSHDHDHGIANRVNCIVCGRDQRLIANCTAPGKELLRASHASAATRGQ